MKKIKLIPSYADCVLITKTAVAFGDDVVGYNMIRHDIQVRSNTQRIGSVLKSNEIVIYTTVKLYTSTIKTANLIRHDLRVRQYEPFTIKLVYSHMEHGPPISHRYRALSDIAVILGDDRYKPYIYHKPFVFMRTQVSCFKYSGYSIWKKYVCIANISCRSVESRYLRISIGGSNVTIRNTYSYPVWTCSNPVI